MKLSSIKLLPWLDASLSRKYLLGMASGLLATSLVFLLLFSAMYQSQLENQRVQASSQLNGLLQASLENAMIKRDLDGLRHILNRVEDQPGVAGIMIVSLESQIRYSSNPEQVNQTVKARDDPGCQDCHNNTPGALPATVFIPDELGREVLRSVNPLPNKPECTTCHGPADKRPFNGILIVDYDAEPMREFARKNTLMLMGSGGIVVFITLLGGWWFMGRFVIRPVQRLDKASLALSQGQLETRIAVTSRDELGRLSGRFNHMAETLKHSMQDLRHSRDFLQRLVDGIPDGVRVIGEDYRVLVTNQAYLDLLGLNDQAPPQPLCFEQSHHRNSPCPATLTACPLTQILDHGEPVKCLQHHLKSDESSLNVEIYAAPMHLPGSNESIIVESIRDLKRSVQFSHEQKLSDLGQLATGVAHEIRNPLTSIRLAMRGLMNSELDEASRTRYLDLVNREIDQCIKISDTLLKLSNFPSRHAQLVDVIPAITETASLLNFDAQQRHINIKLQFDADQPRVLATDSELRMAVLNLMQNAFHALPNGGQLLIQVERIGKEIHIHVEDDGEGIPFDRQAQIFDPFYSHRVDGSIGTGLGLAITHSIIKRHQGRIELTSIPGDGARFTLILPDADQRTLP